MPSKHHKSSGKVMYEMSSSTFELVAFPPFRLDLTVWALRRRATNNVDLWSVNHYSRMIAFDNDTIKIDISQTNKGDSPILQVTLNGQANIDDQTVTSHAFPRPEDLMKVSEEDIRGVGLSRRKARSIKEIAKDAQIHEAARLEEPIISRLC
jgi:hypothetical protein